jgi:hypothetical protein
MRPDGADNWGAEARARHGLADLVDKFEALNDEARAPSCSMHF